MLDPVISAPESFSRVVYPSLTEARSGSATTAHALDAGHAGHAGHAGTRGPAPFAPHTDPDASARAARAEARGHAAGYAAGLRAAEADLAVRRVAMEAEHAEAATRLERSLAASFAALDAAAEALRQRVAPVLSEAEEALVETALDLASAVLGYEIAASEPVPVDATSTAPSAAAAAADAAADDARAVATPADAAHPAGPREGRTARAAVARALDGLDRSLVVGVRLHPADLAALGDATAASSVPLVADARLARGDAEVDLPSGLVDARLVTALSRARAALLGAS
jgi:flagellar assembly protein FliH